jgi:uncharacterized protein YjiS (DUF1127 family)
MSAADEFGLWLVASLRSVGPATTPTLPRIPLRRIVTQLARRIRRWQRHRVERRELAALSDHELRDIGMNRYEIAHLGCNTFWRA